MQQHRMQEAVQDAIDTAHTVEGDEDDCISIGDWLQAFLQALAFDEDLPPKYVSYRPYKGAKLRIFKLLGRLSLWDVSGTNGLVQDPPWVDGTNRICKKCE